MVNKPFNLVWKKEDSGEEGVKIKVEVNVAESGVVNPGSYSVSVKGNVIYWSLGDSK